MLSFLTAALRSSSHVIIDLLSFSAVLLNTMLDQTQDEEPLT